MARKSNWKKPHELKIFITVQWRTSPENLRRLRSVLGLLFIFSILISAIQSTICAPNGPKNGVITTNHCCCWWDEHFTQLYWSQFLFIYLFCIAVDKCGARKIFQCWLYSFQFCGCSTSICCGNNTQLRYLHINLQLTKAKPQKSQRMGWDGLLWFNIQFAFQFLVKEESIILSIHWQWDCFLGLYQPFTWVVVVFCHK